MAVSLELCVAIVGGFLIRLASYRGGLTGESLCRYRSGKDAGRDRTRARVSYWASLFRLSVLRLAIGATYGAESSGGVCRATMLNVRLTRPQRAFFSVRLTTPSLREPEPGWPPRGGPKTPYIEVSPRISGKKRKKFTGTIA